METRKSTKTGQKIAKIKLTVPYSLLVIIIAIMLLVLVECYLRRGQLLLWSAYRSGV